MTLKTNLQKLISRFSKPIFQNKENLTIKPAFACGGVQYYEVPGFFNYPYARAMAARDCLMELDARVTKEYLLDFIAKKNEMYKQPTLDVKRMVVLDNELEQRLKWIASPDAIYKLAGVVYFDQNESPTEVNWQYVNEKTARWKKEKIGSFFLQTPIKKFIPYSELLEAGVWKSEEDLVRYIQTAIKMEQEMKNS